MKKGLKLGFLTAICALSLSSTAVYAKRSPADLAVNIEGDTSALIGESLSYRIEVENIGGRRARRVEVSVDLPNIGTLLQASPECSYSSNALYCSLGRLNPGASRTLLFQYQAPTTAATMEFTTTASSRASERDYSNNSDTVTAEIEESTPPQPVDVLINAPQDLYVEVCYGSVTSFDQCTVGSLLSATMTLNADGTVTTNDANYTGNWVQNTLSEITLDFYDANTQELVTTFSGTGVSANCFQGTATVHNSSLTGGWEGCLQ